MPVYTYIHKRHAASDECTRGCGFEVVQSIHDEPFQTCPTCKRAVERTVPTGTSFRFKGGAPTPRFGR